MRLRKARARSRIVRSWKRRALLLIELALVRVIEALLVQFFVKLRETLLVAVALIFLGLLCRLVLALAEQMSEYLGHFATPGWG